MEDTHAYIQHNMDGRLIFQSGNHRSSVAHNGRFQIDTAPKFWQHRLLAVSHAGLPTGVIRASEGLRRQNFPHGRNPEHVARADLRALLDDAITIHAYRLHRHKRTMFTRPVQSAHIKQPQSGIRSPFTGGIAGHIETSPKRQFQHRHSICFLRFCRNSKHGNATLATVSVNGNANQTDQSCYASQSHFHFCLLVISVENKTMQVHPTPV